MIEKIETRGGDIVEIVFDPETNLPKVPENFFWRICFGEFRSIEIELRRTTRSGSVRVEYATTTTPEIEWVKQVAGQIWYEFYKNNEQALKIREFASQYCGDYPPQGVGLPRFSAGGYLRVWPVYTPPVDGAGDSVYGRDKHSLLCKLGRNCRKCERSLV